MQLEKVTVEHFRSVRHAELVDCDNLNILVGKNNSGKSSLLTAISMFFSTVPPGEIIRLDPSLGKQEDFFSRDLNASIVISMAFVLDMKERDRLVGDIVREAANMKNAVDGLNPALRLAVELAFTPPPTSFAYVRKLSLGGTVRPGNTKPDAEHVLLSVSDESAMELFEQASKAESWQTGIDQLKRFQQAVDSDDWRMWHDEERSPRNRPPFSYSLRRHVHNADVAGRVLEAYRTSESFQSFTTALQGILVALQESMEAGRRQPLSKKLGTFGGEQETVPGYATNILDQVFQTKILYLTERRNPIGRDEAQKLLDLKVSRGGEEVLKALQSTVASLLGVEINAYRGTLDAHAEGVSAEMDVDDYLVEMNGSGIREALRLLLDVEFQRPGLLLIEEPETHLHPALELTMLQYLKRLSDHCQIFLSTHSTNFLDTPQMRNVYLISKTGSTAVQLVNAEDAPEQILGELGVRPSALFMYDHLVFVEGPTDEGVLREWASTLGVNLVQANVGFIHMGGARNFTHFAAEATIAFLTKRRVRLSFVLDRDEKDLDEINALKERLGNEARVFVLERRELENYLVAPQPLREFVLQKQLSSGKGDGQEVDLADVDHAISTAAEELRAISVRRRVEKRICVPVIPGRGAQISGADEQKLKEEMVAEIENCMARLQERKEQIEGMWVEHAQALDRAWSQDPVSLVPGDVLLELVCQQFGVRFKKKSGDSARLAALMKDSDIPADIRSLVEYLGTVPKAV